MIGQLVQQAMARSAIQELVQQHSDPYRDAELGQRSISRGGAGAATMRGSTPQPQPQR